MKQTIFFLTSAGKERVMSFLFHTVIHFNAVPVYYNICKTAVGYYAQILDNPSGVKEAVEFELICNNGQWNASDSVASDIIDQLIFELNSYTR